VLYFWIWFNILGVKFRIDSIWDTGDYQAPISLLILSSLQNHWSKEHLLGHRGLPDTFCCSFLVVFISNKSGFTTHSKYLNSHHISIFNSYLISTFNLIQFNMLSGLHPNLSWFYSWLIWLWIPSNTLYFFSFFLQWFALNHIGAGGYNLFDGIAVDEERQVNGCSYSLNWAHTKIPNQPDLGLANVIKFLYLLC